MMENIIKYKGYIGSVEFSESDNIFHGKLLGIRALVSYEGMDGKGLVSDFRAAVDDYLESCRTEGTQPEVPYKGSTNIRFKPDVYRRMAVYAMQNNQSINSFVEQACEEKLASVLT